MSKLWTKENTSTSVLIEEFTVGRDKDFDILLAEYDVLGSLAHTEMLEAVGLLSKEDFALIQKGLIWSPRRGQNCIQTNRTQECAFSRHIRAADHIERLRCI